MYSVIVIDIKKNVLCDQSTYFLESIQAEVFPNELNKGVRKNTKNIYYIKVFAFL